MFKLKEVYGLPSTPVPLAQHVITEKWVPEVPGVAFGLEHSAVVAMDEEGFLKVKQLVYSSADGERYAALYTMWFRDAPVGIVQVAGRGGRDHFKRWITDHDQFLQMCNYLRTKISNGDDQVDVYDPEQLVYPEEVFHFYGEDFGSGFGYPAERRTEGFLVLFDGPRLIPGCPENCVLVMAESQFEPMPEYIRRGEYVLRQVGKVSDEELARNPRVAENSYDKGHNQIYWYEQAPRPENAKVLSV
jgi:hypothetical protein